MWEGWECRILCIRMSLPMQTNSRVKICPSKCCAPFSPGRGVLKSPDTCYFGCLCIACMAGTTLSYFCRRGRFKSWYFFLRPTRDIFGNILVNSGGPSERLILWSNFRHNSTKRICVFRYGDEFAEMSIRVNIFSRVGSRFWNHFFIDVNILPVFSPKVFSF